MIDNSSRVAQQRALRDSIQNSPRMVAQREEQHNNTGLPDQLKSGIESLSGMSMDHVRVHYNSDKPAQLQAHAYAQGNEIHVAPGQEQNLPHEAWHVVQQAQGRVRPTVQRKAVVINDDPSLEREADVMGERAARLSPRDEAREMVTPRASGNPPIQRMVIYADNVAQIDTVISADLAFQHAMAQGMTLTLDALINAPHHTYRINADEPVVITGHGEPGRVQNRPASEIANALLKIENIDKAAFIYIASCDAATDEDGMQHSSVVDITHDVMRQATKVVGAPGIAVTDYSGITGDAQTHYLKPTQDLACAVEDLITHVTRMHDIKTSRNFASLAAAEAWGNMNIANEQFMEFYTIFIKTLSGMDSGLVDTLLKHCNQAIAATGPSTNWPDWLQGWLRQDYPGSSTPPQDANWLQFRKRKNLKLAQQALQGLRDHEILTLISRATSGKLPLLGKGAGADDAEETGYGRLMGDAEWYRQQRATLAGFGMVGPDQSIKPDRDYSSEYIG